MSFFEIWHRAQQATPRHIVCCIFIASFLYISVFGYSLFPDSKTYIVGSPVRTGGYPLLLAFFEMIFGDYSLFVVAFAQFFLCACASFFLSREIAHSFKLERLWIFLLTAILCLPLTPRFGFGNAILTEAFAYVLSLVILKLLIRVFYQPHFFTFILLFVCFVSAQFVRPQLSFYVFVFVAIALCLFVLQKRRSAIYMLIISVTGFFTAANVDKAYHFINHGFYDRIPFVGTQLIVLPIYVISDDAISKIPDAKDRDLILRMRDLAKKASLIPLTKDESSQKPQIDIHEYSRAYGSMRRQAIQRVIRKTYPNSSLVERDKILVHLTKEILLAGLKNEPMRITQGYLLNLTKLGFGGLNWLILSVVILLISFWKLWSTRATVYFIASVISVSHFVNITIVCLLEPVLFRYSFYTDLPLVVLVLTLILVGTKNLKIEN